MPLKLHLWLSLLLLLFATASISVSGSIPLRAFKLIEVEVKSEAHPPANVNTLLFSASNPPEELRVVLHDEERAWNLLLKRDYDLFAPNYKEVHADSNGEVIFEGHRAKVGRASSIFFGFRFKLRSRFGISGAWR